MKTAKEILYEHCEKNGGAMLPGSVKWIVEAMEEYKSQKPKQEDILQRKSAFAMKMVSIQEKDSLQYNKEEYNKFYLYWTEHNENGRKMRFEMERVFVMKKRLNTWLTNSKKYATKKTGHNIEQSLDLADRILRGELT